MRRMHVIEVSGVWFTSVRDSKIVEQWALLDQFAWLQQLGALPEDLSL